MRSILLMALTALLATACATTQVSGLRHDKSLTTQSIIQGRLVVAGVTSSLQPLEAGQRGRYADTLLWALRDARPAYPLLPAADLAQRLGDARYQALLDSYGRDGVLGEAVLRQDYPQPRYLLLARIENDYVERRRDEREEDVPPRDGEMVKEVRATVDFVTTRYLAVSLQIYDLQAGTSVWHGLVEDNEARHNTHSRTYDHERRLQQSLVELLLAVVIDGGSEEQAYPAPVPREQLLRRVFEGFAKHLPPVAG